MNTSQMPLFPWKWSIATKSVQAGGDILAVDAWDALQQILTLGSGDQETYSVALGVSADELHGALGEPAEYLRRYELLVADGTLKFENQAFSIRDSLLDLTSYLRTEHRLKANIDYAYTLKYEKLNILCDAAYEKLMREACSKHALEIASMHMYP